MLGTEHAERFRQDDDDDDGEPAAVLPVVLVG